MEITAAMVELRENDWCRHDGLQEALQENNGNVEEIVSIFAKRELQRLARRLVELLDRRHRVFIYSWRKNWHHG